MYKVQKILDKRCTKSYTIDVHSTDFAILVYIECKAIYKGGDYMSNVEKMDIEETVNILKQLDPKSLLILDSGARMLKARQEMENNGTEETNR